ncbi:MAG: phage holin family protein [Candidatus Pacebacteria bacterium]|nr:phage holin family protein [Candidatus Paceibacterota bacterium]MBP9867210.1 phage holin family protein [Candidatus Paceibacterota bacterium]
MKYLIFRTFAVLATSYITKVGIPLVFTFTTVPVTLLSACVVALVIAFINHTIKPIFILVSIPINLVTLGLFSFVINGAMILLAARIVGPSFIIPSLLMAIYFSLVLSVVNWVLHIFE